MKKTLTLHFILICFLFSIRLSAQLSGVYTIDGTLPASATNFTTFASFAAAANSSVIAGPVTVNVANAVYNEQVTFNQQTGISATNTITINGGGATLTFSGTTTAPHTLLLSGADYMFFNNLNVVGTNSISALVVHLTLQANNNYFRNCTFSASLLAAASSFGAIPWSLSGSANDYSSQVLSGGDNNTVDGCSLTGGYFGYTIYGLSTTPFSSGNKIINSNVRDQLLAGVYVKSAPGMVVKNNVFENVNRTVQVAFNRYAIYFGADCISMLIDGNRIRNPFFWICIAKSGY